MCGAEWWCHGPSTLTQLTTFPSLTRCVSFMNDPQDLFSFIATTLPLLCSTPIISGLCSLLHHLMSYHSGPQRNFRLQDSSSLPFSSLCSPNLFASFCSFLLHHLHLIRRIRHHHVIDSFSVEQVALRWVRKYFFLPSRLHQRNSFLNLCTWQFQDLIHHAVLHPLL